MTTRRPWASIRVQVVALFLAAIASMITAQGLSVWQQGQVTRALALINEGYLPLSKVATTLEQHRQRVDNDVRRLLSDEPRPDTADTSPAAIYSEALRENLAAGRIHARFARTLTTQPAERAFLQKIETQLERIDSLYRDFQASSTLVVRLAEEGKLEEARQVAGPLERDGNRLSEEITKLVQELDTRVDEHVKQIEKAQARATAVGASLTVVAIGLAFALIIAVLYALRPIAKLTVEVQRLAGGDYGGRVEVAGSDEIAGLASEFNSMAQVIEQRNRTLVDRAEQLNRLSSYLTGVLDSLVDALLVVESNQITLANPAASRVWGVKVGADVPTALRPLLREPGRHELELAGRRLHEIRIAPHGPAGFVVVSADVTDIRAAERRLARSERLALVGQMLAQITHEVRNPLNALSLNAEMLSEELTKLAPNEHEAWEFLGIVSQEIERLTQVTGHYLQLARRRPARLEPRNVADVLEDAARLLAVEVDEAGVRLDVHTEALPPQSVDSGQLRQAVINIVQNAVAAGARQLRLGLDSRGDDIRITLDDDGPGMTPEEVERACDPFYTTKPSGTGLGLAITRQIVEDHDGSVHISKGALGGAAVTLVLPRRDESHSEPEEG